MSERSLARPDLVRALGAWQAAAIVVGTIIGTGVFLKAAPMAQLCGSPGWVLAAWGVGGTLSLLGALSYAELGAAFPSAGGEYVFLREGYGPFVGYLYGWARFWIGTPASIAAYAVGAATFMGGIAPLGAVGGVVPVAIAVIIVFTALNCLSVNAGGWLQTVLTALKILLIIGLAVGALFLADGGGWARLAGGTEVGGTEVAGTEVGGTEVAGTEVAGTTVGGTFPGWGPFGLAVLAALWAYDGWNNLPMAAGEVRNPGRNVPRAIVAGTLVVLAIYAVVNIGYFHALTFDEVATSRSDAHRDAPAVAARVAGTFMGDVGQRFFAFALTVSALSAMAGSMLTGARVPFAMARDGLAPARLAHVSPGAHAPVVAVLIQGGWACILATSGRFDQLTDYVVFSSWLFYAMNAGAVVRLRRRRPDLARPYRVPLYPFVPVAFLVLSSSLLVNTLVSATRQSLTGIGFMALAVPVYLVFHRPKR